jgi:hypothetical protein
MKNLARWRITAGYPRLPRVCPSLKIKQVIRRNDGRWLFMEINSLGATVKLPSVEGELAVAQVYDKVDFEKENERKL